MILAQYEDYTISLFRVYYKITLEKGPDAKTVSEDVPVYYCTLIGQHDSTQNRAYQSMCNESGDFPLNFMLSQLLAELRERDIASFPLDELTKLAQGGIKEILKMEGIKHE